MIPGIELVRKEKLRENKEQHTEELTAAAIRPPVVVVSEYGHPFISADVTGESVASGPDLLASRTINLPRVGSLSPGS